MLPVLPRPGTFSVPYRPINRLERWFDRVFDDLGVPVPSLFSNEAASLETMPLSIWEDEDHFYIEAELPGVNRDDVEISVHNGMLTIRATRKPAEGRTYLYNTRTFGQWERTMTLPKAAEPSDIQATMKDGVLCLKLARKADAKPRRIEIAPCDGQQQ